MDYSHLIRGTREFFQGHPGKPRDGGVVIVPTLMNYPEANNSVKRNHESSYNLQSNSQVNKSNCPAQSGTHRTLSRSYPETYSEDFNSQPQMQSSHQVNKSYTKNLEVKDYTWAQSNIAYASHTPRFQYAEQKVWEQKNYSEGADIWSNTRLNHNQPTSTVPATIPRMATPVLAYQGHQQQVPIKNNERMVPAIQDLHRSYTPEAADCSSFSENSVRLPFVQNFMPQNIYQSHRTVASRGNVSLTHFRENGRQPTGGRFYNQSSQLASHSPNRADNMSAPVSCDCLFNRLCPLHRHSKQQDMPTIKRQSSEWDSKIQNNSFGNNLARQKDEHTSSSYPDERSSVFRNSEMIGRRLNSPQQNYQSQELPTMTSSSNAFALVRANVEAGLSPWLSTNFCPQPQTYLTELSRVKTENSSGSELGGVSVIQQPKNNPPTPFGTVDISKKNEERMSVISYSRKQNVNDVNFIVSNVILAQDHSLPADVMVLWPKKEPATHECESLQGSVPADLASIAVGPSNDRCLEKLSNRTTKPPKLKMQSFEKPVDRIAPTHNFLIDSMPSKSDPIVSDEKWEEWKSSFDTEWNAFVKDLAGSGNIKRIHRVTQPIPKKIKRREQAHAKPMKGSLDSKLPSITDFSSDEDIPLSLRRKTKEDSCN